jgi:mannose-6-phosphate isomerase-like protein (cupin superfamily)|tara:strand:+ start:1988 stop:2350 length:363 start_codon:yes stop_codon:yes gene_type:complete
MLKAININDKLNKFSDYWSPKVIGEMNNYQFKLAKVKGQFIWHSHKETDETFIVLNGELIIEFKNEKVKLSKGELYIVPKGVEHKPYAKDECHIMLIEPKGIINTGNRSSELTSKNDNWV